MTEGQQHGHWHSEAVKELAEGIGIDGSVAVSIDDCHTRVYPDNLQVNYIQRRRDVGHGASHRYHQNGLRLH